MLKKIIMIPVALCVLLLPGCTSKPREVTASIPLVASSQERPNKQEVPTKYWSSLSNPAETNVQHDKYNIQLAKLYISALGHICRELSIVDKSQSSTHDFERRTACEISYKTKDNQAEKAWFLEKQIIESRVYVEL